MTGLRPPLCVGTRLTIDGEAITVTSVEGANVAGSTRRANRSPSS